MHALSRYRTDTGRIAVEESLLKRVMPHSVEAEQSVIGAMIMDRDAVTVASEMLTVDDFYQKQYGVLFEAMVELYSEGKPIDLITLQNRLKAKDVPPEISSLEFVRDMITTVPTSANVRYYAEIVAEKALLRRLIKVNEEIAASCYAGTERVEDILDDTEKKIFQVLQRNNNTDFVPIKEVVLNALDKIEAASRTKGNVTGLATGFIDLDYKTAGFQPSDLILIAARPAMGKTAFALNIAEYMAFHNNVTVAIFSLEMSKEQLVNRLFSMESRIDAQVLRTGNLSDSDWTSLIEAAGTIGRSNLIIDDTPGISVSELRSKCRKYKLEHNLGIVMIDYLQLMQGSRKAESRQQEISEISRSLKELARELQVPVVALSQLSRAVEQRPDHRPMLSDLRESGAIEQDADMVMFLYRDDYYNHDTDKKDVAEVIIAKQRNGSIGTIELAWLGRLTKFANMQK
jgi:replicative DNA helicase